MVKDMGYITGEYTENYEVNCYTIVLTTRPALP